MDFNLVTNIEQCLILVRDYVPINLVYYSHIPASIISLLVGFFVFFRSGRLLAGKVLLSIAIVFSLWSAFDIILWTSYNSQMYMFFWAFMVLLESLIFVLSLYFVYTFIDKKDISFKIKLFLGLLILPIIIIMGTKYHLTSFSITDCVPVESSFYQYYALPLWGFIYIWILVVSARRYIKADRNNRQQIFYLTAGITALLFLFLSGESIANYLIDNNILNPTEAYSYEFYGLFGMPIFLGFLAYLIVKFKAFDIKILGAQALVVGLVILTLSEFFFTSLENTTNIILISVTTLLATIFGIVLIRSVKLEVKRKEELQEMADKLASANDQLRKLDNAKSEFISIASHQLRTPLTAIKGYNSLLLEGSYGKLSDPQKDILNKVYTSNERLIHLVDDLLNLSRIESGRMQYDKAEADVAGLVKEVVDALILSAKNKKLYLEASYPEKPLPKVSVDAAKIREVISNLVDNSIKYTPKGGIKVKAELATGEQDGRDKIKITVSDTGVGITPEDMKKLFGKFSRGTGISKVNTAGTGLGLYVGKKIIEAHNGRVWAESDGENKGSRFIMELPVG